jgi:hypothetical protein
MKRKCLGGVEEEREMGGGDTNKIVAIVENLEN